MTKNQFPTGRDEKRVASVLAHYEGQSEAEAIAEDEAAFESADQTFIEVPNALLPAIRELIAKHNA